MNSYLKLLLFDYLLLSHVLVGGFVLALERCSSAAVLLDARGVLLLQRTRSLTNKAQPCQMRERRISEYGRVASSVVRVQELCFAFQYFSCSCWRSARSCAHCSASCPFSESSATVRARHASASSATTATRSSSPSTTAACAHAHERHTSRHNVLLVLVHVARVRV